MYEAKVKRTSNNPRPAPYTLSIPGLKRDPVTHKYDDEDLAEILQDATAAPAAAFKARGTPHVMRFVDALITT